MITKISLIFNLKSRARYVHKWIFQYNFKFNLITRFTYRDEQFFNSNSGLKNPKIILFIFDKKIKI